MSGLLERGVDALERIAAALEGGAAPVGKPEAPKAEKPKKESTGASSATETTTEAATPGTASVDRDGVRDALKEVQKKHDAQTARDVLAQFGVTTISALDESQYGEVIAAAKAAL